MVSGYTMLHRAYPVTVDTGKEKKHWGGFYQRVFAYAAFVLACDSAMHFVGEILQLPDNVRLVYGRDASGSGGGHRAYRMGMAAKAVGIFDAEDCSPDNVHRGENRMVPFFSAGFLAALQSLYLGLF